MSLKILASLIILIAVVAHATKRQQRIAENREKEFWARERKANSVRSEPLPRRKSRNSGTGKKRPTLSAKNPLMVWIM